MQMAYASFASVASASTTNTDGGERSRWADQVSEAAKSHAKSIDDMRAGNYYYTLKNDPRRNKKADEKVSLAGAPYHDEAIKTQKTRLDDDQVRSTPMPKTAQKFVNKFVEKAKALHAEKERAAAEAAGEEPRIQEVPAEAEKKVEFAEVAAEVIKVEEAHAEKPVEEKPAEVAPVEAAPVEEKLAEVKVEEKQAEVKVEEKASEVKVEEKPVEAKSEEVKPVEATEPAKAE